MSRIGAVVIGRNEAHNLPRCLTSVVGHVAAVVFVDSGSTDGSVAIARRFGVDVVELDASTPFTVARARNAGFERLGDIDASIELVQFVDGDSEMVPSWFPIGRAALLAERGRAVVFGRWRERAPQGSIFARVYQMDSDPRLSTSLACPGMAMMRLAALRQAGGFNSALQGLEDHELSLRLHRLGWKIERLDAEMAVHDSGAIDWRTWLRRRVRGGHGLAQAVVLHGRAAERLAVRRSLSIGLWGLLLPATALASATAFGQIGLLLLASYPALATAIYLRMRRLGFEPSDAAAYATLGCLAKFPQALGQIQFYLQRFGRSRGRADEMR